MISLKNHLSIGGGIIFGAYTDAERDALNLPESAIIWNTTTKKHEYFDGTNWIKIPAAGCCPDPIVSKVTRVRFPIDKSSIVFCIEGSYLTPSNIVTSSIFPIASVTFISSNKLEIIANTTGIQADLTGDLLLDGVVIETVETINSTWIDFRLNGDTINDLDLVGVTNANFVRDADGVGTTYAGGNWSKMIGVRDAAIPRAHSQGYQVVVKKQVSGYAMFGMAADGHGIDSSMYNEGHANIYPQNQNTVWGFYAYAAKANSNSIAAYDRLKFVVHTTSNPGDQFSVYGLVSGDDWDGGTLIYTDTMPNGTQDPGNTIYPTITPHNGATIRLQAFNALAD